MYTLPLTCREILIDSFIILFAIGVILTYFGYEELGTVPTSWMFVFGLIIVILIGIFGGIYGAIEFMEWLSGNVKCKCDAQGVSDD